jgi:DNA/RNA endonuclease G (NUC1)
MKKTFSVFLLSLLLLSAHAQEKVSVYSNKPDTVFVEKTYRSFYSFKLKEPLVVSYVLTHGGGDESRDGMVFRVPVEQKYLKSRVASDNDYAGSGYDQGHLTPAKDHSHNITHLDLTFRWWNCFPQSPSLNRGSWKRLETVVREESQHDTLIVVVGGFFSDRTIGSGIGVPDSCFKMVYSLSKKTFTHSSIFYNPIPTDNTKPLEINIEPKKLIKKIRMIYHLDINKVLIDELHQYKHKKQ